MAGSVSAILAAEQAKVKVRQLATLLASNRRDATQLWKAMNLLEAPLSSGGCAQAYVKVRSVRSESAATSHDTIARQNLPDWKEKQEEKATARRGPSMVE